MTILFYISAVVAFLATVMAISRSNAVHALLYLVVSLLAASLVFFTLGAPFIAALEVIIYAGAIMVLFIFVVMMLNVTEEQEKEKALIKPQFWIGPAILTLILALDFVFILGMETSSGLGTTPVSPQAVGYSLFTEYLLGVELAAMLLMAGIVGAYHLGRKKKTLSHRFLQEDNPNG